MEVTMTITLPSDLLQRVGINSEADLRLALAIALCREVKATRAQAAAIAGLSRTEFEKVLADRHVPASDEAEWKHDLKLSSTHPNL